MGTFEYPVDIREDFACFFGLMLFLLPTSFIHLLRQEEERLLLFSTIPVNDDGPWKTETVLVETWPTE